MIIKGDTYGDPRRQASREDPHGLTPNTIESLKDRFENFLPGLASTHGAASKQFFDGLLPDGAAMSPTSKTANCPSGTTFPGSSGGGGYGSNTMMTPQRPYQPEFESPDRQQYPVHRILANRYWRLFYKLDPVIGNCLDMYSTMPWSDFQLSGEGVTGEIKEAFETMCQETQVLRILEHMVKEFLVIGEAVPHCWTPDQLVYTDKGFVRIDNIKEGDLVLTHENRLQAVTDIYERDYSGTVLNFGIHKLSALPVQCTTEHPLYILKENKPEWTRANEVSVGDYVGIGVDTHTIDIHEIDVTDIVPEYFDLEIENDQFGRRAQTKDTIQLDNDFMRLVGYYYAEGNAFVTTRKGRVSFSFNINEDTYHNDVISIIRDKFGVDPKITTYESKNTKVIHVNSRIIAKFFLNLFGTGCRDKKIPPLLRKLPIEKQKHFLIGLFRGDGNIYTNKASISTAQIQLSHKGITHLAWQILLRMGVVASFNQFNRERYGKYWKCSFNANNYNDLANDIFETNIENKKPSHKRYKEIDGKLFFRIESISEEEYVGSVWNLEVGTDHSYVVGGIVGHNCFFDDIKGIWTYIALHNPDQLEVIDAPFIKMEPIVEFIPDDRLRAVLTSNNHLLRQVREQMPPELISRLIARQNIPLSPINMTFIPRRMHPYDTRGTSIISRMWRILMYEDAIYNASIATARRHAGPIKVAKLGNPQTGWIPSQEHEKRLLQLLAQAEMDVNAWLVYHYGINFEMVGTTDRIMNISQHHEVIERIKLIAMGISKSFLHGEVTYACGRKGEQILMSNYQYKNIEDVEEDDRIIDKNGKIQTVEKAWCEGTPDELYEINLWGNKKLVFTNNHKWPVWAWPRTCACGCGEEIKPGKCFIQHHHERTGGRFNQIQLQYIDGEKVPGGKPRQIPIGYQPIQKLRSDELRAGDYLMIPRKFKANNPNISLEQARLLGYYIAEGCIHKIKSKKQAIWFCFSGDEYTTLVDEVCKLLEVTGFDKPNKYKYESRNASRAVWNRANDSRINWFIKHGGEYSHGKRLSKEVMHWPVKYKIELIRGMYFGDGSQYFHNIKNRHGNPYKQFMVVYTTVSKILADQLQLILAQLGFYAVIDNEKKRIGKDGSERKSLYLVKVYGNHARNLSKLIWEKDSKADTSNNEIRDRFKVDDDYIYIPIRSIKKIKNDKPVYNLSVTGSHSYIANGIGTFNSSITGLSVFLQRMRSVRSFFVNSWLLPKFFKPIAKINGWAKRDKKELTYRYRIKRSQREIESENRWIVPKVEWEKQLDHNINSDLVSAMQTLEQMGIKFSKTTKYASVGRKFEEEVSKIKEEQQYEQELNQYISPEELQQGGPAGGVPGGKPPPMPGGPKPTGMPGGAPPAGGMPTPPGGGNIPNAPGGGAEGDKTGEGGGTGPSGKKDPAVRDTESGLWDHKGKYGNWSASEVQELANLIREGVTDSPLWGNMDGPEFRRAVNSGDVWEVLNVIEEHLEAEGYPHSDVRQLRKLLDSEGILKDISDGEIAKLKELENNIGDGLSSLNDEEAMDRLSSQLDGQSTAATKLGDPTALFIGQGNERRSAWSGDISDIMEK